MFGGTKREKDERRGRLRPLADEDEKREDEEGGEGWASGPERRVPSVGRPTPTGTTASSWKGITIYIALLCLCIMYVHMLNQLFKQYGAPYDLRPSNGGGERRKRRIGKGAVPNERLRVNKCRKKKVWEIKRDLSIRPHVSVRDVRLPWPKVPSHPFFFFLFCSPCVVHSCCTKKKKKKTK